MTRTIPWALAALLVLAALVTPFNHDETQYYAAARLSQSGLPYRDFVYLQTPLFAWWGAAIGFVAGNWFLIAGRVSQALLGLGILALAWRGARQITGDARAARVAVVVIGTSYPFLFSTTVFRNDMLPTLLEMAAVVLLARHVREPDRSPLRALAPAGLLIGLAASAKVNFGLVGVAPALWVAVYGGTLPDRLRKLTALALGALAGLVPTAVAVASAPEQALWQIVHFAANAPHEWYLGTGQGWRLGPAGRVLDALVILLQGPALVLIVMAVRARLRRGAPDRMADMLDALTLAALVAALIPAPSWRQYFIILLPPLALRAAWWWHTQPGASNRLAMRLLAVTSVAGLLSGTVRSGSAVVRWDETILARESASHRLGSLLRQTDGRGAVATLAPEYAVDSGFPLDPAFAAGPFVFRWKAAREEAPAAPPIVNAAALAAHFRAHPPRVIVTGRETDLDDPRRDLDRALRDWAMRNAYRSVSLGDGGGTAHLAPLLAPWRVAKRAP